MNKFIKHPYRVYVILVFLGFAFTVSGCVKVPDSPSGCNKSDMEKFDGCFAREYLFKIDFSNGRKITENMICQEYYDQLDFSTRGNFWTYRETGLKNYLETRTIVFDSKKYGRVKMGLPRCVVLIEGEENLLDSMALNIGETVYGYQISENNIHYYNKIWGDEGMPEKISFDFDVSIELVKNSVKML